MQYDPADTDPRDFYQLLVHSVVPRPIGWISTRSRTGVDNLAPYSFFNAVCAKPPTVMFSGARDRHGNHKHSVPNALDSGVFCCNIVPRHLAAQMNASSGTFGDEESEFAEVGLTPVPSDRVAAPLVGEADVHLECRVVRHVDLGEGPMSTTVVFGEVVLMHVADRVLRDGKIAPDLLDAIGRMGGAGYVTTRDYFDLDRPS